MYKQDINPGYKTSPAQYQPPGLIYPLSLMRLAIGHVTRGLESLKKDGCVKSLLSELRSRRDLYVLLDYSPGTQWIFPANRRK